MLKWVVCKYPEVHGSEVKSLKVPATVCLSCPNSYCPTKLRVIYDSFPPVVNSIPERGLRMLKTGHCPLKTQVASWCTATRTYCKYNTVCSLADKFPKKTLVIKIKEVEPMYAVKIKKTEGPMPFYGELEDVTKEVSITKIESVFKATQMLVAKLEFVPKTREGQTPAVKTVRGIDNLTLIDENGVLQHYEEIVNGNVEKLYIVEKELVPAVGLEKVPIAPQKKTRTAAPTTKKKK